MNELDVFRKVFIGYGYTERKPYPIFPSPDKSTLFTSATISVVKGDLLKGEKINNIFLLQPCLRANNLKNAFNDDFDPVYSSSFLMLGTLSEIQKFSVEPIVSFFNFFPDFKERILIRTSKSFSFSFFNELENFYKTEYDTRKDSYYSWLYGSSELSGKGITFSVLQNDGSYLDLGNLVVMFLHGNPKFIEFGFGLEVFRAALNGVSSPYLYINNYMKMGLSLSKLDKKMGDSLNIAFTLYKSGVLPGRGKESSVMRRAIRIASFLFIKKYGLDNNELTFLAKKLSSDNLWLEIISSVYKKTQDSIKSFLKETAHIKNHLSGFALEKKINEYYNRYSIPKDFSY